MPAPSRVVHRILDNVLVSESGCWVWQRSLINGYGQIGWHESGVPQRGLTHRLMYEAAHGAIPGGLTVDHLCHDPESCREERATDCPHRACCNPAHMQAVTPRTNVLRGGSFAAANAVKTECPSGHPYDTSNTYIAPDGSRQCRTCRTEHVNALRRQIA